MVIRKVSLLHTVPRTPLPRRLYLGLFHWAQEHTQDLDFGKGGSVFEPIYQGGGNIRHMREILKIGGMKKRAFHFEQERGKCLTLSGYKVGEGWAPDVPLDDPGRQLITHPTLRTMHYIMQHRRRAISCTIPDASCFERALSLHLFDVREDGSRRNKRGCTQ